MEQYNLSPLLPHREKVFALLFPLPSIHASYSQQMTCKTPSHSMDPGYKSGLRTPVQRLFPLELACCSNSISHSNKFYFPLILSHVWKFFSNPHLDHYILHMGLKSIREGRTFWDHKSRNTIKYLFFFSFFLSFFLFFFFFAVFDFSC